MGIKSKSIMKYFIQIKMSKATPELYKFGLEEARLQKNRNRATELMIGTGEMANE